MINFDQERYNSDNIIPRSEIENLVNELRFSKKRIGLCSGSFDVLHPGHLTHLESAKRKCDILFVAVAEDELTRKKEDSFFQRPVFPYVLRSYMVSRLKAVDFVIADNGSMDIFHNVRPHIYFKGRDYVNHQGRDYVNHQGRDFLKSRDIVEKLGGIVEFTDDEKLSTTDIVRYIKER